MKSKRLLTLLLAGAMLTGSLCACAGNNTTPADSGTKSNTATEAPTSGATEAPTEPETPVQEPEQLEVAGVRGTTGLSGDFDAVFKSDENGQENAVTGGEQSGVPYAVTAALKHPTVITSLVVTAPTENQADLAGATIEASVNGQDWVLLKTIGSTVTAGKVYTLRVADTTQYSYVRIRQAESARTKAFRVRTLVLWGVEHDGPAGDIALIADEQEAGTLISMSGVIASATGTGSIADAFLDNQNSFVGNASSEGNPNYLIGTMTKKTEIRKVVVKLWGSNRQMRGTQIQGSTDGMTWVTFYTVPDLKKQENTESGTFTWYLNDSTQYSFIRVIQRDDLAAYAWTVNTVLVYGVESKEDAATLPKKFVNAHPLTVTFTKSETKPHNEGKGPESLWDTSDKSTMFTNEAQGSETGVVYYMPYIEGSFAEPTVITKIVYTAPPQFGSRARTSYFEASVDGKTWVKIATLPSSNDLYGAGAEITLTVNDDTGYLYIRLCQGAGFYPYYWTLGTAEVFGVTVRENQD